MTNNELRDVGNALVRLNGLSKAQAAQRAKVNSSNTSSWLNGEDRKLSLENQLATLSALGVRYGLLRRDMLHEWIVGNDVSDVNMVLSMTGANKDADIFIEETPDVELPCRITIKSPLGGAPVVIEVTRPLMKEPPLPLAQLLALDRIDPQQSLPLNEHRAPVWRP